MASSKNPSISIDPSKTLAQFLRSRSPIFITSFLISVFFFAVIAAGTSPAISVALAATNASYLFSSIISVNHTSNPPSKNQTNTATVTLQPWNLTTNFIGGDVTLFKKTISEGNASSKEKKIKYKDLVSCKFYDGKWVVDKSAPPYAPGSCPFIDGAFDCIRNGRSDLDFMKLRWQPYDCKLPRLNGKRMLEMLRGKRVVFVGDSLNRNMWESLVCILRQSLEDKKKVFEISGRREFRKEGFYAFNFIDYNCSIEFVRSPFLVREWTMSNSPAGINKATLRLDLMEKLSSNYSDADVLIFNTGHWWTHEKTSKGKDYYQEGDYVYPELNVAKAYRKALQTWAKWVDHSIDPNRTRVFFRGYSASHFSGGQWKSGGNCYGETQPIKNDTQLTRYPQMMTILESVIGEMRTPVSYLNVTRMTGYRKDGHPSVFRIPAAERLQKMIQDCSHWCLPGVPDAWNEILYAELLISSHDLQISHR